jgi:hypothetical protein
MGNKVISSIERVEKTAKRKKLASILSALSSVIGRKKVAFLLDAQKINRAIKDHLRKEGFKGEEIPDVDFGSYIIGTVQNKRKRHWTEAQYEEVISSIVGDLIVGENIDTSEPGWGRGNFAQQVRDWQDAGKSARDMRSMIGKQVAHMATLKAKRVERPMKNPLKEEKERRSDPLINKDRDESSGKGDPGGAVMEETTPTTGGKFGWMNFLQKHDDKSRIEDVIEEADRRLKSHGGDEYIIWQAYKQLAPVKKYSEFLHQEFTYEDPETGEMKTETLMDALGIDKEQAFYYRNDKLKDLLKEIWPSQIEGMDIEDYM